MGGLKTASIGLKRAKSKKSKKGYDIDRVRGFANFQCKKEGIDDNEDAHEGMSQAGGRAQTCGLLIDPPPGLPCSILYESLAISGTVSFLLFTIISLSCYHYY